MTADETGTVTRLTEAAHDALRPLLPRHGRYALLEFPHYPNAGDSAIWLGTRACFAHLGAPPPAYVASVRTYRAEELERHVGDGPIFLQGGGSFGDLWPELQAFREALIRRFADRAIVQLPQTIHYRRTERLAATRALLEEAPRFTLLVRDHRSLEIAERSLGTSARLAPDLAFALGRLERRRPATSDVLWLKRADSESAFDLPPNPWPQRDWPGNPRGLAWRRMRWRVRRARRPRPIGRRAMDALARSFDEIAALRTDAASRALDEGRVIITDRLHGHILCLLRRQPHVVLDNSYGKLRTFAEAWTASAPHVAWASTPQEALQQARDLLGAAE